MLFIALIFLLNIIIFKIEKLGLPHLVNSFSRAPEGYISDFNSNYVCSEKPEAEDLDKIDIDTVLSLLKPTLQDILNKIKQDFNK